MYTTVTVPIIYHFGPSKLFVGQKSATLVQASPWGNINWKFDRKTGFRVKRGANSTDQYYIRSEQGIDVKVCQKTFYGFGPKRLLVLRKKTELEPDQKGRHDKRVGGRKCEGTDQGTHPIVPFTT